MLGNAPTTLWPCPATLYVSSDFAVYAVPSSDGGCPGVVRDRGGAYEVESLEELHELTSTTKGWPKGSQVHPLSIYVLQGRFSEEGNMDAESGESLYVWYMRFKIRGLPDSHENLILRHMPAAVVLATLCHYAKNAKLKHSSLITDFQPHLENSKPLPMQLNGFKKVVDIHVRPVFPAESDSGDEYYDEHQGEKGTWMMKCWGCGKELETWEWCCDLGYSSKFFRKRPLGRKHARRMRLFLGLCICKAGVRRWRLRAADRAYAPGARGYANAKSRHEATRVCLGC